MHHLNRRFLRHWYLLHLFFIIIFKLMRSLINKYPIQNWYENRIICKRFCFHISIELIYKIFMSEFLFREVIKLLAFLNWDISASVLRCYYYSCRKWMISSSDSNHRFCQIDFILLSLSFTYPKPFIKDIIVVIDILFKLVLFNGFCKHFAVKNKILN